MADACGCDDGSLEVDGGCDFKGDNVMVVAGTCACDGGRFVAEFIGGCGYDGNFVTVGVVTDVGGGFCGRILVVLVVVLAGVLPCDGCGSVIPEGIDADACVNSVVTNGGGDGHGGGSLVAVVK